VKKIQLNTPKSNYIEFYNYINRFTKKNKILITIILPLYNEEKTIRPILNNLPIHDSIEIIVVDDHSTDNSSKEIEKVKKSKNFRVITHKKNTGYGAAIISGIRYSKGDIIVTMDTDGQHNPDDILTLIKPILDGEVDYTIGSRYLGRYYYNLPLSTRIGELLTEKLIQLLFGIKIMNNQNGFRAFRRELTKIFNNRLFIGYAFCTEQILQANLCGYRIKECPIKVYDREFGTSKIILRKLALNIFSCLFIYYLRKIITIMFKKRETISKQLF
jgi:glycosyltransferase involved in cell wall biosynthesis